MHTTHTQRVKFYKFLQRETKKEKKSVQYKTDVSFTCLAILHKVNFLSK